MNYNESMPPYGGRRSSDLPAVIITSGLTAAAVTVAVLFVTGNLKPPSESASEAPNGDAAQKDDTRQVPPLIGLTPEVAVEVLNSRDLRLVVQGRRPDGTIKEGQIAEQDPLAQSEIPVRGAVTVVVSAGSARVEVPDVVGKSAEEAEKAITDAKLKVKGLEETGQCAPGTVCETVPSKGASVDEGSAVTMVVSPALTVPDVVGMYMGKAKEELKNAGLKVGKIRWRSNDYKDENIVLSQEPAAGEIASPGDEINLFVNE